MPSKDPTKLESETCNPLQESALVYLPIPTHEASLTVLGVSNRWNGIWNEQRNGNGTVNVHSCS